MVDGLAAPPPKLMVIQVALLPADLTQLAGVPVIVNVPLLAPALAKAPVLFSVTVVQVCANAGRQRNSAMRAPRKLITNVEPQIRFQVAGGTPTFPAGENVTRNQPY